MQKELPGADDTSGLGELIAQIKENDRALEAAEDLVAYLKERGQLIESAALKIIDDVIREVEHQAQKKPGVAKGYTQTLAYREAKAEKISEGRKRATKGNSKKDDS